MKLNHFAFLNLVRDCDSTILLIDRRDSSDQEITLTKELLASFHRTTSGTWGLQAGAQSTAVFLLFMTDDALARFEASEGWSVGADANVTLVSVGANAQITTETAQQPVIGFVLSNRGLMAGLTLNGTRVTRLRL